MFNETTAPWWSAACLAPGTYNKPVGPPIQRRSVAVRGAGMVALVLETDRETYYIKMTGPEKGTFNSVWYGLRDLPSGSPVNAEVVVIGVSKGRFEALAPGKNIVEHMFEFYLPSQDGDGDGLPDADETPVYGMQVTSIDTRLPSP